MGKRTAVYAEGWTSVYPNNQEQIWKTCEFCGLKICINNYPDKKPRTPKLWGMVICVDCDPRPMDDRWKKKGARISHPRRLRRCQSVRLVALMAKRGCDHKEHDPKCFFCVAKKVMNA